MEVVHARDAAAAFSKEILGKAASIVGVSKTGDGWKAMIEVVEEEGFVDDVLGVYEIVLDDGMNVISYKREGLRRRRDVSQKEWQKEY